VHHDITCSNIMQDRNHCTKIIDFGISCIVGSAEQTCCTNEKGTRAFKAPERTCGFPVDVYGAGVVFAYWIHQSKHLKSTDTGFISLQKVHADSKEVPVGPGGENLLQKMLEKSPQHRITVTDALQHQFLAQ